jgi:uridine kinase
VAGPSSSGKTSFANRLLFELMSKGLRPIRISIDDFYIPRDILKPGTDLESVDALDVPFFNKVITDLVSGEEVSLPTYDFKSGNRLFQKPIRLEDSQPMIIEGIHALNPLLTEAILTVQKYRIYIAPQPQVNLDYHTPMSMTDMRLLRRIARDSRTRNSSASDTIRMWPNVRGGEFKYIYPTQENADYVFDSFMHYELSALRNIVLPLLEKVAPEEPEYQTARRLMQMVRYFLPIPIEDIPCNSLMREFVGGTSFKDAR